MNYFQDQMMKHWIVVWKALEFILPAGQSECRPAILFTHSLEEHASTLPAHCLLQGLAVVWVCNTEFTNTLQFLICHSNLVSLWLLFIIQYLYVSLLLNHCGCAAQSDAGAQQPWLDLCINHQYEFSRCIYSAWFLFYTIKSVQKMLKICFSEQLHVYTYF